MKSVLRAVWQKIIRRLSHGTRKTIRVHLFNIGARERENLPQQIEIVPYRNIFPATVFLDKLRWPDWKIAVFVWFMYYGVTFIISLFEGIAIPGSWVVWLEKSVGWRTASSLKFIVNHPGVIVVIQDRTHNVFSFFLVPIGGIIFLKLLRTSKDMFQGIWDTGVISASEEERSWFLFKLQRNFERPANNIIAVIMGMIMWGTFVYMSNRDSLVFWWGHRNYGIAGYYLGFAMGVLTYVAVYFGIVVLEIVRGICNLMRFPVIARPFHPDRCGGVSTIGRTLFLIYLSVAWGALTIFVVYWLGYFGLERTPTFAVVIGFYGLLTPITWIWPTLAVTKALRREKQNLLSLTARSLHEEYEVIRNKVLAGDIGEEIDLHLELIERTRRVYDLIEEIPVWPFDIRRIQAIVIGNVLQIGGFLVAVISLFKSK